MAGQEKANTLIERLIGDLKKDCEVMDVALNYRRMSENTLLLQLMEENRLTSVDDEQLVIAAAFSAEYGLKLNQLWLGYKTRFATDCQSKSISAIAMKSGFRRLSFRL
jgi:hypothetical protein